MARYFSKQKFIEDVGIDEYNKMPEIIDALDGKLVFAQYDATRYWVSSQQTGHHFVHENWLEEK